MYEMVCKQNFNKVIRENQTVEKKDDEGLILDETGQILNIIWTITSKSVMPHNTHSQPTPTPNLTLTTRKNKTQNLILTASQTNYGP